MKFCSKVIITALTFLVLCLPHVCSAQISPGGGTYYPGDWSDATYTRIYVYGDYTGTGVAEVATNGTGANAVTYADGDYAFATGTSQATFTLLASYSEDFHGVVHGTDEGVFASNGYGNSNMTFASQTIVSDTGQANHNYTNDGYWGCGAVGCTSTAAFTFTVTTACHDNHGETFVEGDIDKNTD